MTREDLWANTLMAMLPHTAQGTSESVVADAVRVADEALRAFDRRHGTILPAYPPRHPNPVQE